MTSTEGLTSIVIFSLLTTVARVVLSLAKNLLGLLFLKVDTIGEQTYVAALDTIVSECGVCSGTSLRARQSTPGEGWHCLPKYFSIVHKKKESGWRRSTNVYTVVRLKFVPCSLERDVRVLCEGKNDPTTKIENLILDTVPNVWQAATTTEYEPMIPRKFLTDDQTRILDMMISDHLCNGNGSLLVAGTRGTGKTALGVVLATELQLRHKCWPVVISGFHPTRPTGLSTIERRPSSQRPFIYVVNEIDTAVKRALIDPSTSKSKENDNNTYADNKSSFNDFMDRRARRPHEYWIFTTNDKSLLDPEGTSDATDARTIFFRDHRIRLKATLDTKVPSSAMLNT